MFGFRKFVRSQLEGIKKHMSTLDDKIAQLKADADATKALVTNQVAQLADLKSQLAAALAAGQPPTDAQLKALDDIHAELSGLVAPPSPAPVADPAATPAPTAG